MRTFTIQRLTPTSSGSKKMNFVATGAGIEGFLESASAEFAAIVDGEFGKTFQLFADDAHTDIKIGDRITDDDGEVSYDVKGVTKYLDGPGRKLQVTLTLPTEQ